MGNLGLEPSQPTSSSVAYICHRPSSPSRAQHAATLAPPAGAVVPIRCSSPLPTPAGGRGRASYTEAKKFSAGSARRRTTAVGRLAVGLRKRTMSCCGGGVLLPGGSGIEASVVPPRARSPGRRRRGPPPKRKQGRSRPRARPPDRLQGRVHRWRPARDLPAGMTASSSLPSCDRRSRSGGPPLLLPAVACGLIAAGSLLPPRRRLLTSAASLPRGGRRHVEQGCAPPEAAGPNRILAQ
jgi:hypothetical protein